jgi:hypothetical protein
MAQTASSPRPGIRWLATHWVTGAGFMASGLLALAPLLYQTLPFGLFLIFLHSPVYMLHQLEEHVGDRFRCFINDHVFNGMDILRVVDVLVINLPLVWGVNLAALYAAFAWNVGDGLVAPYAMLVNAFAHFAGCVRFKTYNPGTVTAAVMFVPLSIVTIKLIGTAPDVTLADHMLGLGLAVLIHGLIILQTIHRRRVTRNGLALATATRTVKHSS